MLILNINTGRFLVQADAAIEDSSQFAYVRGEQPTLPLQCSDGSGIVALDEGQSLAMYFIPPAGGAVLAEASPTVGGTGADTVYTFRPQLATDQIDAALGAQPFVLAAMRIDLITPGTPPVIARRFGRIYLELANVAGALPTGNFAYPRPIADAQLPGESMIFTSPGGKRFRLQFNDDETMDVIKILP